jgi:hypothetical protein
LYAPTAPERITECLPNADFTVSVRIDARILKRSKKRPSKSIAIAFSPCRWGYRYTPRSLQPSREISAITFGKNEYADAGMYFIDASREIHFVHTSIAQTNLGDFPFPDAPGRKLISAIERKISLVKVSVVAHINKQKIGWADLVREISETETD